jgi:hypothetical protein
MLALVWHLMLAACGVLIARHLYKGATLPRLILDSLILFYAIMVTVVTTLGALAILSPPVITVVLVIILAATVAVTRPWSMSWPTAKMMSWPAALLCTATLCVYTVTMDSQSILPPVNTDALLYHLPFARHLLEQQSLSPPPLFFTDVAMTYYPKAGVMPYFMLMHTGREYLLNFAQLPFVAIGALSLYLLMRHAEWRVEVAISGAVTFALLGPVIQQASLCFVDLIMASSFLATLHYLYTQDRRDTLPALLAAGLLVGMKSFALMFMIAALPLLLPALRDKLRDRRIWVGLAFLVLIAGYNYWQNLWLTGNPIYPGQVTIGGIEIFPGIYDYAKNPFIVAALALLKHNLGFTEALGTGVMLLLPFPVLLALVIGRKESKKLLYVMAVPWIAIILYLILVPPYYHGEQVRHLLPAYTASVIGCTYLLQRYDKLRWATYCPPLLLFGLLLRNPVIAVRTIALVLIIVGIFQACVKVRRPVYGVIIPIAGLFLFLTVWRIPLLDQTYNESRNEFFRIMYRDRGEIWAYVDENSDAGKTIAHVGLFLNYGLRGSRMQNTVIYQSVNSLETKLVHEYPSRMVPAPWTAPELESVYRQNPSVEIWLQGLTQKGVDWLLVRKASEAIEKSWIVARPHLFTEIYATDWGIVYSYDSASSE